MEVGRKMKVEIWSDVMCPFCYIGKHVYESALEQFPHKELIDTEWMSYQLDPEIPERMAEKVNTYNYLASRKKMDYEEVIDMHKGILEMAKENELQFNFDKTIVANTFKAHRIIQLAKEKGLSGDAEDALFRAFFVEGEDIADDNALIRIGIAIGLSEEDVKLALTEEIYAYRVKQDIQEAHNIGLTGVPFFVFNRRYGISGAEPLWVFTKTFDQAYEEWEKERSSQRLDVTSGQSCDIGGECI